MIEVRNLTKKYGSNLAVDDLSFTIGNGRVYGFLGPNGAGKSTTMNIITGCLAATSGTVLIDGHDIFEEPLEAKRRIGYLPEQPPLYTDMTPAEYLNFVADAKGVPYEKRRNQVKEVMELTGITGVSSRLISHLSKGYRQRVGIAQALLGNPDTIILDEPTVGLDPKQIIEVRELIKELGKSKTVIISSHIMQEISAVCDTVIIISHGHLMANNTIAELEAAALENSDSAGTVTVQVLASEEETLAVIGGIAGMSVKSVSSENGTTTVELSQSKDAEGDPRETVALAFSSAGKAVVGLSVKEISLEDIFLDLTDDSDDSGFMKAVAGLSGAAVTGAGEIIGEIEELSKEEPENGKKKKKDEDDDYKPLFSSDDGEDDR